MKILYIDNQIIVVEKPQGMLSQSDNTGDEDILTFLKNYLKKKYDKPGNVYLGLLHRLDRPVGGVMVFARTSKAASRLSQQIRERQWEKTYLAVIHSSNPELLQQKLIGTILKQKNNKSSMTSKESGEGKNAELSLGKLAYDSKNKLMLVKINLRTGRSHQIRVQLSDIGKPIYGDMKYGKQEHGNIALWSYLIQFVHPTLKTNLKFVSIPPKTYPWNLFEVA